MTVKNAKRRAKVATPKSPRKNPLLDPFRKSHLTLISEDDHVLLLNKVNRLIEKGERIGYLAVNENAYCWHVSKSNVVTAFPCPVSDEGNPNLSTFMPAFMKYGSIIAEGLIDTLGDERPEYEPGKCPEPSLKALSEFALFCCEQGCVTKSQDENITSNVLKNSLGMMEGTEFTVAWGRALEMRRDTPGYSKFAWEIADELHARLQCRSAAHVFDEALRYIERNPSELEAIYANDHFQSWIECFFSVGRPVEARALKDSADKFLQLPKCDGMEWNHAVHAWGVASIIALVDAHGKGGDACRR